MIDLDKLTQDELRRRVPGCEYCRYRWLWRDALAHNAIYEAAEFAMKAERAYQRLPSSLRWR